MNLELTKIIDDFRKEPIQENYNKVLLKLFTNVEQSLWLPSKIRSDKNGFVLKSIIDDNGKDYLIAYTDSKFIDKNDESFIEISFKGIIEKVLSSETCDGICINPDSEITINNSNNQLIILKEYIIKLYNN